MMGSMSLPVVPASHRLMRRRTPPVQPVTARSIALFRLGEFCNNHCPMCSNSGRPEAFLTPKEELLRRVEWMHAQGLRRVVVTGGEPTGHPAFWAVIEALGEHGLIWDINSNGRTFAQPGFADRAVDAGLQRAIISLHSHVAEASMIISGVTEKGHREIVGGIDALLGAGVPVMLNLVLNRHNIGQLRDYLAWTVERWGSGLELKVCFPTTLGHGGGWEGIDIRYGQIQEEVRDFVREADLLGVTWFLESIPACVSGETTSRDMSRSGFGESHYLDDISGDRLYPIGHIEAELSCLATSCRSCVMFDRCPGIPEAYARRHGTAEFVPVTSALAR